MKTTFWIIGFATALVTGPAAAESDGRDDGRNHYILCDAKCEQAVPPDTQGVLYADNALAVAIGEPGGVVTDATGNVYFTSQHIVFRLDAAGTLTRIAGNGMPGYSGDGGPAINALLNMPPDFPQCCDEPPAIGGLAVDAAGSIYVADWYNGRVRKIGPSGIITTVLGAGTGGVDDLWPQGVALDSSGNLYVTSGGLYTLTRNGSFVSRFDWNCLDQSGTAGLCSAEQMAVDAAGDLYIAEICSVRKVSPDGAMVTVAGSLRCGFSGDGGPAIAARLSLPYAVAVDSVGNLYIADTGNSCVRKVDTDGIITTFAGKCGWMGWIHSGYYGDGAAANRAGLLGPSGIAVDADDNLYIADTSNRRIRKVTPDGIITTVAGNGEMLAP